MQSKAFYVFMYIALAIVIIGSLNWFIEGASGEGDLFYYLSKAAKVSAGSKLVSEKEATDAHPYSKKANGAWRAIYILVGLAGVLLVILAAIDGKDRAKAAAPAPLALGGVVKRFW